MKPAMFRATLMVALVLGSWTPVAAQKLPQFGTDGLDNVEGLEIVGTYLYSELRRNDFTDYATGRVLRRVSEITGVCDLDAAATKRLDQAAKADVDRMKRKIQSLELEYRGTPLDTSPKCRAGIAAIQQFKQDLETDSPLSNSLVERMLPKILNKEQRTQLATYEREKAMRRIEVACRVLMSSVERSMPMAGGTRGRFLDRLLAFDFPKKFASDQELPLAFSAFLDISEAELAEIFDEGQVNVIKQYRARWAGLATVVE